MDSCDTAVSTDVVVVGAGPSGLRAANLIQAAGRSVVVLEARDRVGGRLLSAQSVGHRFDLGATWFWPNERRISALAGELGLHVFEQHLAGDMMYQPDGRVQRIEGNQLDVSSRRFSDGAQSLAESLARQLDEVIRFNEPVRSIRAASGAVDVHSDQSHWRADAVVLAVPPATARASMHIEGLDDITATVATRTPVWMGATVKVVAHYDRPFWRDAGLAGAAFSHLGPLREIHDMSGPGGSPAALFGFAQPGLGGPSPERAAVLDQLVTLFGPRAASPLELWMHDWRSEPFTVAPDALGLADYSTYGHRVFQAPSMDGRLHWASTETATDAAGHIEGALAAAERAAAAIIG